MIVTHTCSQSGIKFIKFSSILVTLLSTQQLLYVLNNGKLCFLVVQCELL